MNATAVHKDLSESLEDYLEAILSIVSAKGAAKARDIARRLNVNNSSVTGALKALAERGMVNYAPYDLVTLTEKGADIARDVTKKHVALRDFFHKVLLIDIGEADEAACKMEHYMSPVLLDRFIRFTRFVEECPRGGDKWLEHFNSICHDLVKEDDCEACIVTCLNEYRKSKGLRGRRRVTGTRQSCEQKGGKE